MRALLIIIIIIIISITGAPNVDGTPRVLTAKVKGIS
jgi:hypothetical protein